MEANRKIYENIVASFNASNGYHVALNDGIGNKVTPTADVARQAVAFSMKLETMMILYDLAEKHKMLGGQAISHFALYHGFLSKGMYDEADEVLSQLAADADKLLQAEKESDPTISPDTIAVQTLFALCHELSHIYYHSEPEKLASYKKSMRERIQTYKGWAKESTSPKLTMLRQMLPKGVIAQEMSFDEVMADENGELEEIACDELAWNMMRLLLAHFGYEGEDKAVLCAHIALALNYLEIQYTLENFYLGNEAMQNPTFRFNSVRHLIHGQTIWECLHGEAPALAKTYQSYIDDCEKRGRWAIIATVFRNIQFAFDIRQNKRLANAKQARLLAEKYATVDAKIRQCVGE